MENLDGTVITTALPQIARSFGTDPVGLNIGITAYLLAMAVFVPLSGWIADRVGARTTFASAIVVFILSSVLCGVANGVATFTAARIVQGIGGAMMVPVGRLVVLRNTEKRDLVRAISTIVWPGLVAPVLGPPLGGFITDHASWRWIFFINVPLGLIALFFAFRIVPNLREVARRPFDATGFLLVGLACVLLTVGFDGLQWPLALGGVAFGGIAALHLRRAVHPLVALDALRVPTFAYAHGPSLLARCAIGAVPFLLALFFTVGFGLGSFAAGSLLLWVFAGNLSMKTITSAVLHRFGFRRTLLANGFVASLTILLLALLTPSTPVPSIAAVLFVGGMCRSMQFTALNTLGYADVPPETMGGANTLSSMINGLTFGAGPAFGALALSVAARFHGHAGTPRIPDFQIAFGLASLMVLATLPATLRLPRDAGKAVTG